MRHIRVERTRKLFENMFANKNTNFVDFREQEHKMFCHPCVTALFVRFKLYENVPTLGRIPRNFKT